MPAPTQLPSHDSNLTNQPAAYPSALQSDGFPEKYNAPNTIWNYLFHWALAWIKWLSGGTTLLYSRASEGAFNDAPAGTAEEVIATYTLPAGTFPSSGKGRLRVRAVYDIQAVGSASAVQLRLRAGGLAGLVLSNYNLTSWGVNTTGQIELEADLSGESNGGVGFSGNCTDKTAARHGTSPSNFEHNIDFLYNPAFNTTAAQDIVVTVQCTAATVTTAYLSQFQVEFGLVQSS